MFLNIGSFSLISKRLLFFPQLLGVLCFWFLDRCHDDLDRNVETLKGFTNFDAELWLKPLIIYAIGEYWFIIAMVIHKQALIGALIIPSVWVHALRLSDFSGTALSFISEQFVEGLSRYSDNSFILDVWSPLQARLLYQAVVQTFIHILLVVEGHRCITTFSFS